MIRTSCETVQPELKAYLDGALSLSASFRVKRHLRGCEVCRAELAAIERLGKELKHMSAVMDADSDTLDPGLRARILAAIPPEPATKLQSAQVPLRARRSLALTVMVAGAASVIIAVAIYPRLTSPGRQDALSNSSGSVASVQAPMDTEAQSKSVAANGVSSPPTLRAGGSVGLNGKMAAAGGGGSPRATAGGALQPQFSGTVASPSSPARDAAAAGLTIAKDRLDRDLELKESAKVLNERASVEIQAATTPVHTYLAANLESAVKTVRNTVSACGGEVSQVTYATNTRAEMTLSVPAPQSAGLIVAITRASGGAVRYQSASTMKPIIMPDAHVNNALTEPKKQDNFKMPLATSDVNKRRVPTDNNRLKAGSRIHATDASGRPPTSGQTIGGGSRYSSVSRGADAMVTVKIRLLKSP